MSDTRIFYGPHACERCGKTIAKAAREDGGEEFDYPSGPIYPNTAWTAHACPTEAPPSIVDVAAT